MRPTGAYALCLLCTVIAGSGAACTPCAGTPEPEDPELIFGLVEQLLDDGDAESALVLMQRHALAETERGLRLTAEARIIAGQYDIALNLLTERIDLEAEDLVLLDDACAMGALAALEIPNIELAKTRLSPCASRDRDRIDIEMIGLRASGVDLPPEHEALDRAANRLREATPSPELDVAAEQLERYLLELADAAENPMGRLDLRRRAFEIGQDPELGSDLIDEYLQAARDATDPQQAATLYEHVYLARIDGLDVPDQTRRRASELAQDVLFPVFAENLSARYERKWSEEDIAAGIFDPDTETFSFPPVADDASRETVVAWIFARMERPRPTPHPDYLAISQVCQDPAEPCTFAFEDLARWAYFSNRYDDALIAEIGRPLQWP